nr:hypothetical protein [Tanacetum cinerariifolium]
MLMRSDELYKFNDGTLTRLRTSLEDITKDIQMEYLPKRRWSSLEKKRAHIMIKAIEKLLKERRMMRSLEKFIGGRHYIFDLLFHGGKERDVAILKTKRWNFGACNQLLGEGDNVVEEEDAGWICFLGGNNSSGTKKCRGSNSGDGGNTEDEVKIVGGVIGSYGGIGGLLSTALYACTL